MDYKENKKTEIMIKELDKNELETINGGTTADPYGYGYAIGHAVGQTCLQFATFAGSVALFLMPKS
jgi:bacteriocin-like protein